MKTAQLHFKSGQWTHSNTNSSIEPQLILAFGSSSLVSDAATFDYLHQHFPKAQIVLTSTAGEILGSSVYDDTLVATAIEFEKTSIKCIVTDFKAHATSFEIGEFLLNTLLADDLAAIVVLSEGSFTNGSELVQGLNNNKPSHISITGGLAGDGTRFQQTYVGLNQPAAEGKLVAIGFYGTNISIGHSSFGGWDEFGRERRVTKCEKNVLYELDNQNALDLYKEYLGPYVDELPGSALLFPLSLHEQNTHLVRTILSIDEKEKTMTFAGNLPEGSTVRLMKANFERLIEAASNAAQSSFENNTPQLALLISCVGRKIILQERTHEELEAAQKIFGHHTTISGFYSYGEISPFRLNTNCELHNQTMTITTFAENI